MDQSSFIKGHISLNSNNVLTQEGQPDQITAKHYLEKQVFPYVEQALGQLLDAIEKNGEFEKYVDQLAERQLREQRELRKREKERKRLEMGDDYVSSEDSDLSHTSSNSDKESDYDSETSSKLDSDAISYLDSQYKEEKGLTSKVSKKSLENTESISEQFNALRFLGLTLKDMKYQK